MNTVDPFAENDCLDTGLLVLKPPLLVEVGFALWTEIVTLGELHGVLGIHHEAMLVGTVIEAEGMTKLVQSKLHEILVCLTREALGNHVGEDTDIRADRTDTHDAIGWRLVVGLIDDIIRKAEGSLLTSRLLQAVEEPGTQVTVKGFVVVLLG